MFIAQDESNVIQLFARNHSGKAVSNFDAGQWLGLPDKEVDIEGSCASPSRKGRIYWIGSLSNNKNGKLRPERDRLFATDIVGQGVQATLRYVGFVKDLRSHLVVWGEAHGYHFKAYTAKGVEPKRIDGFNVEGLEMGPDGKTLFIALRAPLVGPKQDKALIIPLLDFEAWFAEGRPTTAPVFGNPIELDLGKRGIRSLGKNARNEYLIVAGSYGPQDDFALYQWNGQANTPPIQRKADLRGIAPEGIVEVPEILSGSFTVQLLSDMGEKPSRSDWVQVH